MLGINDPQIWIAYLFCFVSVIGCIIYGILKWNVGAEEEAAEQCSKALMSWE